MGLLTFLLCLLIILILKPGLDEPEDCQGDCLNCRLVFNLHLTDLAIWNEARYTRHPSQADFFAPFQDGPGLLERFPSGTLGLPAVLDSPRNPEKPEIQDEKTSPDS
jgi:hypothetical protein